MLPLELLYRDVDSLEIFNLDNEFIKNRLRECFFIIQGYWQKVEINALKGLLANKEL